MTKKKKISFPGKKFEISTKLEILHTNLSGPTKKREFYDGRYFMILVDYFNRMMWVVFLRDKFGEFEKFKVFKNIVENESRLKIKCLISNRGGEFISKDFKKIH